MPEEDDQAGQVDESPKEFQAVVPTGDDPPKLVEPGKQPLDLPAAPVSA